MILRNDDAAGRLGERPAQRRLAGGDLSADHVEDRRRRAHCYGILPGPRVIAATPVRDTSTSPIGRIRSTKWSILEAAPVISKMKLSVEASTTRPRKRFREAQRLLPVLAAAGHLDHRQLALDAVAEEREIRHRMHRHEAVELQGDLLDVLERAGGDDGDA